MALLVVCACEKGGSDKSKVGEGKGATPAATTEASNPVVIEVNGKKIHQTEFEAAIESLPENMRNNFSNPRARQALGEELVRMKLLEIEGERLGVENDADVKSRLAVARTNVIANSALQKLAKESKLTPQQLYERLKPQLETVKARQIVIPYEGSMTKPKSGKPLSAEEAKTKALGLVTQLRGGADFAKLATRESADPNSSKKGGDLGELTREMLPPELARVVFSLPPKQVSDPVMSRLGWHIFEVNEKATKSFEEVKGLIEQQQETIKAQQIVEEMRGKAKVTFDPSYFGPGAGESGSGAGAAPQMAPPPGQ